MSQKRQGALSVNPGHRPAHWLQIYRFRDTFAVSDHLPLPLAPPHWMERGERG
jgi:hypothetical protein